MQKKYIVRLMDQERKELVAAAAYSACSWGNERPGRLCEANGRGSVSSHKEKVMTTTGLIILIVVLVLLFGGGGGYYWSRGRR